MTPKLLTQPLGPGVNAAITTAEGGRSRGAHASLNLSFAVNDDPANVRANRRSVATALGYDPDRLVAARQVHGPRVTVVGPDDAGRGALDHESAIPDTDALVTNVVGVPLIMLVADCAPILLADPVNGAVGVAHAGWRGAAARVAQQTVSTMTERYGTDPALLRVVIGPHIALPSFEMGAVEAHECAAEFPGVDIVHHDHGPKPHVDLRAMLLAQLRDAGVPPDHIGTVDADTLIDDRFFSHRRSMKDVGDTSGRFAGIITLT